jgi:hypothetical protein
LSLFNMVTMPQSNGGVKQTTMAIGMQKNWLRDPDGGGP